MTTVRADPRLDEATAPRPVETAAVKRPSFMERLESFISRLSTRNNFWQKVCSLVWLPYAFRSGITMKRLDANRFSAVLPFRRFNRNWYNAMAGAALLGNSEVAAGMYIFSQCDGDYIVVCKDMRYRFLRPCYGPAVYTITEVDDLKALVAGGGEFNVELELDIRQQVKHKHRSRRVGHCRITFHCTPRAKLREAAKRRQARSASSEAPATTDD